MLSNLSIISSQRAKLHEQLLSFYFMPSPIISIGRLIDETWDIYKLRFNELMSLSSWLLLLAILFSLSLSLYPSASTLWLSNELSWSEYVGVILFAITNYFIAPLLGIWVLIALSRLVHMHIKGKPCNVKKAVAEVMPRFFPTIIVSVMVGLLLIVTLVIGFGPTLILATLGTLLQSPTLIIVGNIVLAIGVFVSFCLAFKWMIQYMLAPYTTIIDGLTDKKALSATQQLVKGRFWGVVLRLAIPKMVFLFIGIVLMGIVTYATSFLLSVVSGLNMDLQLRLTTLIEWVIPVVIAVLINPLLIIADLLLYTSLKGEDA